MSELHAERAVGDQLLLQPATLREVKQWLRDRHQLVAVPRNLIVALRDLGAQANQRLNEGEPSADDVAPPAKRRKAGK